MDNKKVKLNRDIPVCPTYGLIKGRVLDVFREDKKGFWVLGDVPNDPVRLWSYEYEVLNIELWESQNLQDEDYGETISN